MERLTFDGNFCDIAQCRELPCKYGDTCTQKQVWERLARYEDTRLTPAEVHSMYGEWNAMMSVLNSIGSYDRLRELAEADRAGRVVVLPCKVGDTIYRLQYIEQTPGRFTVGVVPIKFELIWLEKFGETVFLSREEAEKALQEMKGDTEK